MVTVTPYSSEVQQPMRATAVLGRHPRTHYATPFDHEQGRAGSLHPEGHAATNHLGWIRSASSPELTRVPLKLRQVVIPGVTRWQANTFVEG
jgi:hypothetical protein